MNKCKKCGIEKSVTDFYSSSPKTCKECVKKRARENRSNRVEYYRDYDRKRGNRQSSEYIKEYRAKYPNKYKAHCKVNNSLRDHHIKRKPCEICGSENSVAHHDDYSYALEIRWLCQAHHKQWHAENGDGKNP